MSRVASQPHVSVERLPETAGERELVAAVLQRDRKAASRLVAAHIDAVYAYARHRLTPRTDLVDDVVQDVFLAALNGLAGFHGQSSLRTWLIGIARHKIEDVYRQLLRLPETLHEADTAGDQALVEPRAIDEEIDSSRMRARAREVLARMPERYGILLLWRYWEQRSIREIAAAIGTTEKSIERMLARARTRFKELWLEE